MRYCWNKRFTLLCSCLFVLCMIVVAQRPLKKPPQLIDNHAYVDLGLSVKWATMNLGATNPYDSGEYFAWGEIRTKVEFVGCLTYEKEMKNISGNPLYDAAYINWGGNWRLPTTSELQELKTKCTWDWVDNKGYIVIGPNGNSIFLPVTGYMSGKELYDKDTGYYWSDQPSICRDEYYGKHVCAWALYFSKEYSGISSGYTWRTNGRCIRPVTDYNKEKKIGKLE